VNLFNMFRFFVACLLDRRGQPFGPENHQGMAEQPEPEGLAPGTVIRGWTSALTLNGRPLKPALVVVAKSPG